MAMRRALSSAIRSLPSSLSSSCRHLHVIPFSLLIYSFLCRTSIFFQWTKRVETRTLIDCIMWFRWNGWSVNIIGSMYLPFTIHIIVPARTTFTSLTQLTTHTSFSLSFSLSYFVWIDSFSFLFFGTLMGLKIVTTHAQFTTSPKIELKKQPTRIIGTVYV